MNATSYFESIKGIMMSTLTTIEELQKQLTLILGFSGKENLDVGEIIGVGKLTKEKTHD